MDEIVVKVSNLSKRFKDKVIFENVNFELTKGKIYGFTGYNGCGKSVLFKILSGLMLPTDGDVFIHNKKLGKDIDFPPDLGVIIESPGFLDDYSGYYNLKYLASIRNIIGEKEIKDVLKLVGLENDSNKKVKKYSLGMRQRLAIAQAIMENPKILILDEPFNGLDKNGVANIRNLLFNLKKNGTTILIASHISEDIRLLCDEVFEFDNSTLIKVL
ncbi:ATP-binding cassette domain-containing protein [Thermoanaerobacterium thermosaccharolyticum]|uniref:ATP-binding cassette domain-containing protein n=1 Tax=Thermoanaerobacterium thermosaccharolyticum TaxID=1517 RepID=UPI00279E5495|nr:ATP-binding cassette domain-containing protein [Thermoanaerobacterium thermosaccharolyticum]